MVDRTFNEALRENIEKITGSAAFVSLYNPAMADFEADPWPAIQLAIAILLDKPILVAETNGRAIPPKLRAVADLVVTGGPEEIAEGIERWLKKERAK